MRSEKPYTKSENVISRFLWHRIDLENEKYSEKEIVSKAQFHAGVRRSKGQNCKQLVSKKKVFFSFMTCRK